MKTFRISLLRENGDKSIKTAGYLRFALGKKVAPIPTTGIGAAKQQRRERFERVPRVFAFFIALSQKRVTS